MTSTTVSTPRLSEVARHLVYPEGIVTSGWPRIERRLADMAIHYDQWEEGAARLILARNAEGRYVATIGGVTMSLPRQVGKTFTVGSLLIAMCIEYPGLRVVWTSHHLRTTTNTFRSMQGMVRRKKIAPHIRSIRVANGEQEITFTNGSIIMFGAREHGFGVGIDAIDVMVCDEAQRLHSKSLADMLPTTNVARHEHGALLFFIGTPPRPTDNGDEFAARRRKALAGTMTNGIYIELSADQDADLDDPKQWAKANASYPHRTPHESMLRLRENLTDDGDWRREALGIWDEFAATERPIPLDGWKACEIPDDEVPTEPAKRFALTMSPERVMCLAAAVPGESADYLDLVDMDRVDDSRQLIEWLVERRKVPVMIDSRDPAASLANELRSRGVKVNLTTERDMGKACGGLLDAVNEGRIWHCGQPVIAEALKAVSKRDIGHAGLWEFDMRDSTVDHAPLRAMTLAHYGLSLTKKRRNGGERGSGRKVVTG